MEEKLESNIISCLIFIIEEVVADYSTTTLNNMYILNNEELLLTVSVYFLKIFFPHCC